MSLVINWKKKTEPQPRNLLYDTPEGHAVLNAITKDDTEKALNGFAKMMMKMPLGDLKKKV